MSFRLYVGNYPSNFTLEDINNVFRDFDVTIDKMIQKEMKSYCFVICKDMDEAVSVFQKLSGTSVSGRNLVIRACEQSLQDYISVLLLEENDEDHDTKVPSPVLLQNTNKSGSDLKCKEKQDGQFEKKSCYSSRSSQINYKKCDKNEDESLKNKPCFPSRLSQDSDQRNNENDADKSFGKDSYSSSRVSHNSYIPKHKSYTTELLAEDSCSSQNSTQISCQQEKKKYGNNESFENNSYFSRVPRRNYLRKYEEDISESLEKDSYCSKGSSLNSYQQKFENNQRSSKLPKKFYPSRYEQNASKQYENNAYYSTNIYQRKHGNYSDEHFDKNFSHSPNSEFSSRQTSKRYENLSGECSHESSYYYPYQHNYAYDHDSYRKISPRSKYAKNLLEQRDENTVTWLSVTNFPFRTTIPQIYELFSDYDPIEVEMICNAPSKDMLTEALVCFWNQDIANDVMMNFDNTVFNGRVILVNDIEDFTIINELLCGVTRS